MRSSCRKAPAALSFSYWSKRLGIVAAGLTVSVAAVTGFAETKTGHRHSADRTQSADSSRQWSSDDAKEWLKNHDAAKWSKDHHSSASSIPSSTADAESSGSASATRSDPEALPESALPALPEIPRLEPQQPNAEDIQELSAKLNGLFSDDTEARDSVMSELVEIQPRIVPAVRQRVLQLAEHADKEKMKRLFSEARRETLTRRGSSGPRPR